MQTLYTNRTVIRSLKLSDFQDIIDMYLEPDSNKFIPPLQNKTPEQYKVLLSGKINNNNNPEGLGFWSVRTKENDRLIGTANLNIMNVLNIVHTGIHLRRSVWNMGFASEIISEMLDYGLNSLKLPEIYGICSANHIVSEKMLMKAGLVFQESIHLNGEELGIYKITPSL